MDHEHRARKNFARIGATNIAVAKTQMTIRRLNMLGSLWVGVAAGGGKVTQMLRCAMYRGLSTPHA
jgi:hypothetical protein